MESSIYSLFKVSIENLVQNKVVICKNFRIQPSELMRMPYWEYELTIKECERIAEEEKKKHEEQEGKYRTPSMSQYQRQQNQMMRGYQNNYGSYGRMPSMPSAPAMPKIPKI
jgi:hypothetical protein